MAMFGKDVPPKAESRMPGPPVDAVLSIVAAGMTITGDVQTAGTLKVDGDINGSITGARQVLIGRNARICGNVTSEEVVVGGIVDGSVSAGARLELQSTATITGDIETRSIVVIEGARMNGMVRMAPRAATASEPLRLARA